jgi:TIR domain
MVLEDPARVYDADTVIVVTTPAYDQAWGRDDEALDADSRLIRGRFREPRGPRENILHLVLEDNTGVAPPRDPKLRQPYDFRNETYYPVSLFDLVLALYAIRFDHPAFEPLREGLRQQWLDRLGAREYQPPARPRRPLKIFISYAHRDEIFKDALVKMLAGLQRRGVIDAWQDRRIEEGDQWREAIETAMNECGLALLLVSGDFLASRFIQDEELPRLLQRRKEQGLRVVPIIVRPCPWQSEPVLGDLQALPGDARAVITFPEETGERDQAWTDISRKIEAQATQWHSADQ